MVMSYDAEPFGPIEDAYAPHRGGYPESAITWALEPVLRVPDLRVLDLGAGTGKLTEAIQHLTGNVIAVEADPGIRSEFVTRVAGAVVLAGGADAIPLPDERVHAVLIGRAPHWFGIPRVMREIARVLTPGGVVAALWNNRGHADSGRQRTGLESALFTESVEQEFIDIVHQDQTRDTVEHRDTPPRITVERAIRR